MDYAAAAARQVYEKIGALVATTSSIGNDTDELQKKGNALSNQVKLTKEDVRELADKGCSYIDRVTDVSELWSVYANTVRQEIAKGKRTTLDSFITKEKQLLSECKEISKEFTAKANPTHKDTVRSATECDNISIEASRKKETAQFLGGVSIFTLTVLIVAISALIAGMIMFSSSYTVGLMGIAVFVIAVITFIGTLIWYVINMITTRFNEAEQSATRTKCDYDELEKLTIDLTNKMRSLERVVNNFAATLRNIETSKPVQDNGSSAARSVQRNQSSRNPFKFIWQTGKSVWQYFRETNEPEPERDQQLNNLINTLQSKCNELHQPQIKMEIDKIKQKLVTVQS